MRIADGDTHLPAFAGVNRATRNSSGLAPEQARQESRGSRFAESLSSFPCPPDLRAHGISPSDPVEANGMLRGIRPLLALGSPLPLVPGALPAVQTLNSFREASSHFSNDGFDWNTRVARPGSDVSATFSFDSDFAQVRLQAAAGAVLASAAAQRSPGNDRNRLAKTSAEGRFLDNFGITRASLSGRHTRATAGLGSADGPD